MWTDERGPSSDSDIYGLNLTSNEERAICIADGVQWLPAISGKRVVWMDERKGRDDWDNYAFNLKTGEEQLISE